MGRPRFTEELMKRTLDALAAELAAYPEPFGRLFSQIGYVVLLPVLEFPYTVVRERLVLALASAGIPESEAQAVSLHELVRFALRRANPYWAGQAVAWVEAGFPLDREIAEALDRRATFKVGWPDELRDRAFMLVRRWERQQRDP
jgi:hypothetical protein